MPASGQKRKIRHAQRRYLQMLASCDAHASGENEGTRARIARTDGKKEAESRGLVA